MTKESTICTNIIPSYDMSTKIYDNGKNFWLKQLLSWLNLYKNKTILLVYTQICLAADAAAVSSS